MRRKSTRNASKSTTATPSTPEPTRRTTRSSRRKKSPSPEIQQQEEDKNEIINDSLNESLVEQETESDVSNIIDKESDNKIDDDNVNKIEASHTPPHSGSSTSNIETTTTTTTSPTTQTTIMTTTTTVDDQNDDTDDKGKSNSELNENSEIKMNSVDSISADVVNNQDDTVNNRDIEIEQQQTVDKACDEQLSVDDDNNEKKDSETVDNVIINLKTNGDIETSKDDVEQAEEGEITESKSDEETSHQNENIKKHSSIKIKLRRNSLFDEIDRKIEEITTVEDEVESKKKFKWDLNRYDCLKLTFNDMFKLNVDDFKELCTDLKLIDEKDVKLEEIYKPIIERTLSTDDNNDEEDHHHHHHDKNDKINLDDTETTNIIALNRKISIVDDSASKLKPPPSPAKQPISSILFISNLVRPFTIKQLKELLERTGTINEEGFWTDRIKSKCYVQYNSIEDAEATRNALHGVNWPIGNGKKLIIEYSTEEEMEKAKNPPSPPTPVPVTPQPVVQTTPPRAKTPQKENEDPIRDQRNGDRRDERKRKISEREKERGRPSTREWDIGKEKHSEKGRDKRRRHSERSVTPLEDFIARKQKKIEESVPQKLMDDLFQRTRAMPCIYWQPLTPEEISVKQQQRLTRMEEHKRRMEENSRNNSTRGGRGDAGRGAYRRRYD